MSLAADTAPVAKAIGASARALTANDRAHAAAGKALADRARALCPRKSGRLANSIAVHTTDTGGSVGSPLIYAAVIQNGSRAHNIRATHFLDKAAEQSMNAVTAIYVTAAGQILGAI